MRVGIQNKKKPIQKDGAFQKNYKLRLIKPVPGLLRFFLDAHLAACCALIEHFGLDRRLFKERPATVFLQNACALVFLLKTAKSAVDGLMLLYDNAYH